MNTEEMLIEKRKEKVVSFFKKPGVWVVGLLIVALILGIYIRSLPMLDHGGKPGLWDITTNNWTLGPDLDPWLFTRYAKIIAENGSLPAIDSFRNVPRGFDTAGETKLLPNMLVLTYRIVNWFGSYNMEFAASLFPVIMFALTIISFFLFVREIFNLKDGTSKTRANVISLISTFFMIVIPIFLSRTIAGIPEKESAAFFFMFLAFYLFLKAWKSEKMVSAMILGILAGISTGLMGLIWGGVTYVFITIAVASMIALIINKVGKKEAVAYAFWIIFSFVTILTLSGRYSIKGFISSIDTGLAILVIFTILVHFVLLKIKFFDYKFISKLRLPKNIVSLIVAVLLGILLMMIFFGPGVILEKIDAVNKILFNPVTGRWNTTVAENRQPYFNEWSSSFGPIIKGIPILFWLFFFGSVFLFRKMFHGIKKKDSWILTILYVLFFLGLVFSRYAPHPSLFDGENFISKFVYFGSAALLIGTVIYFYVGYKRKNLEGFEKINFEYVFLFSLFVICLMTARGAVRVIMVLGPVAPIFVGSLIYDSIARFRTSKDETMKFILGAVTLVIILMSIFAFWTFYNEIKGQANVYIPSQYNQQWQKAMQWVRDETPTNSVFAHWWDYGYWVQSIGNRATVLDGGNSMVFWNYYMGRLVLTGDNQKDALDFLYAHNATHLLIDSSDIGKYGAFSSIGSDANMDRYSWIQSMYLDDKQTTETSSGKRLVYQQPIALDEDISYTQNGTKIFLPAGQAAILGILFDVTTKDGAMVIKQPQAVFYYQGVQRQLPLRYVYLNGQLKDFETGVEGVARIVPTLIQGSQGVQKNDMGSLIYISPRVLRGFLAQKYLMNDPFERFPNFKVAHTESDFIVSTLRSQGMQVDEIIDFQGIRAPITIWDIDYTGSETVQQKYLDNDYTKYLSWQL